MKKQRVTKKQKDRLPDSAPECPDLCGSYGIGRSAGPYVLCPP